MGDRVLRKRENTEAITLVDTDIGSMATVNYEAKVTGELAGLTFQLEEALEDLEDVNDRSIGDLRSGVDELKRLRVNMVKVNCELKNIRVLEPDTKSVEPNVIDKQVDDLLKSSKRMINSLQTAIKLKETKDALAIAKIETAQAAEADSLRQDRKFAFDVVVSEITSLSKTLTSKYDVSKDTEVNTTRAVILERKELKASHAVEHTRLRSLCDRIIHYTDVHFDKKDELLSTLLKKAQKLDELKELFEVKLHQDIEKLDLSDQMLQLATQTSVDIGKFSGSLDKGLDYYSFKSKFLKAYVNHPKLLIVERLINNHLEGRAKDCIGSLDDLESIWTRLKDNFGNVEQLLAHHIQKMIKFGSMQKLKSHEQKMHYLQDLVNTMKDTLELAIEHDLENDLHYSTHLTKIVTMLEKHLQSKWYKLLAEGSVRKPQRWERLSDLLNEELKILQIRTFFEFWHGFW